MYLIYDGPARASVTKACMWLELPRNPMCLLLKTLVPHKHKALTNNGEVSSSGRDGSGCGDGVNGGDGGVGGPDLPCLFNNKKIKF